LGLRNRSRGFFVGGIIIMSRRRRGGKKSSRNTLWGLCDSRCQDISILSWEVQKSNCMLNSFLKEAVNYESFDHDLVIDNAALLAFRGGSGGIGKAVCAAKDGHQGESSFVFSEIFFKGNGTSRGKEIGFNLGFCVVQIRARAKGFKG
jgi:hypothetical protein